LLAELLLIVAQTTHRMLHQAGEQDEKWLTPLVREAVANLALRVASPKDDSGQDMPANMVKYIRQVVDQVTSLVGPFPEEASHAD
jgi:hypothetical protein